MTVQPGWYTTPQGEVRYWDGTSWGPVAPIKKAPAYTPLTQAVPSGKGLAITSLVLALVGGLLAVVSLITGPLAIIFGGIAVNRASARNESKTMAIWGIVIGALTLIYAFGVLV